MDYATEQVNALKLQLEAEPSHKTAIAIDEATKEVWVAYYGEWVENKLVIADKPELEALLRSAADRVTFIKDDCGLQPEQQADVEVSVQRIEARIYMLGITMRARSNEEAKAEIGPIYQQLLGEGGSPGGERRPGRWRF